MGHGSSAITNISLDDFKILRVGQVRFNERIFDCYQRNGFLHKDILLSLTKIKYDVYISFDAGIDELSRNNHARVSFLVESLTELNLISRISEYNSIDSVADDLSDINCSQIVLVVMTNTYVDRVNSDDSQDPCCKEFNFICKTKPPSFIIPIVMEPRMKNPTLWKGVVEPFLSKEQPYIDCSEDDFSEKLQLICDSIRSVVLPLCEWDCSSATSSPRTVTGMKTSCSTPSLPPIRNNRGSLGTNDNKLMTTTSNENKVTETNDPSPVDQLSHELEQTRNQLQELQAELNRKNQELETLKAASILNQNSIQNTDQTGSNNDSSPSQRPSRTALQIAESLAKDVASVDDSASSVTASNATTSANVIPGQEAILLLPTASTTVLNPPIKTYKGRCVQTIAGHVLSVCAVAVAANGDIYSGGEDKTIRHWRADLDYALDLRRIFTGHTQSIECLLLLGNGQILSGSKDMTIKIWDIASTVLLNTLTGHTGFVLCAILWTPSEVISGSADKTLRIWDLRSGRQAREITGADGTIQCMAKISEDVIAAGELDKGCKIRIYSISRGVVLQVLSGHSFRVYSLAVGFDNELISVSADSTLKIWTSANGDHVSYANKRTVIFQSSLRSLLLLPDGSYLVGFSDGKIEIWNESNNFRSGLREFTQHTNWVNGLAITQNGEIVSCSNDKTIRIWV